MKSLAIQGEISIRANFDAGGRPPWTPRKHISKRQRGTNILVISGHMKNVSGTVNLGESCVPLKTDPRARPYARIQQEGGIIQMPARTLRFRRTKGRLLFAGARHKRIEKETVSHPYTITIPARPYMIIPPEDFPRITTAIQTAAKV